MRIRIGEAIGFGWKTFWARPWHVLGITLVTVGLFVVTAAENALYTALGLIVYGGYLTLMLAYASGKDFRYDDLFVLDKRWIYFAFVTIIKGILVFLGFVAFIVPGIYFAIRWSFAELLVLDQGLTPFAALKRSNEMTRGHWWQLFWFSILAALMCIIGFLVFIIGAVIAGIVVLFAIIHFYRALSASSVPIPVPTAQ